ncbi:hypothetical protein [Campylobacter sp. 2014D-0216]|nr:hypothetical protein [Campylobacter sp. 2014D-0216]
MKILLLNWGRGITIGGGAERVVANLANALFELGHDIKFLVFINKELM